MENNFQIEINSPGSLYTQKLNGLRLMYFYRKMDTSKARDRSKVLRSIALYYKKYRRCRPNVMGERNGT